jgi:hypothetical protein
MVWTYHGKTITQEQTEGFTGFVYIITNTITCKKYIGQKIFRSKLKRKVKGKVKRVLIESSWNKYYGSSLELQRDVKELGEDKFTREILFFCKNKAEMNYRELKLQMELDVVLKPTEYYNGYVGKRISAIGLQHLVENIGDS